MRKSSWILLGVCLVLALGLGVAYLLSRPAQEGLTQEQATQMVREMQAAVAKKDVNGIMRYVAPGAEPRLARMRPDQLRVLLMRAFRESGRLTATCDNFAFQTSGEEATLEFDLSVTHQDTGFTAEDYNGRITLNLQRVEAPRFLGLFKTKEWRIVEAQTTGKDPSTIGEW
jgi:hypothetical protein